MFAKTIREKLLSEAKQSPDLLSDLAGLENYIAESYNNRSFIELLQNADDSGSTKFKILKVGDLLYVANNGRLFNELDFESLCRSAASSKIRTKSIGYRGIGFKSVVGFAQEIHIISGELEVTFSKARTQIEIPNATRVPLIRVPHFLLEEDKIKLTTTIEQLRNEGFTTIFVFTGIQNSKIEAEFETFNYRSLIFLRNVTFTDISISQPNITYVVKNKFSDTKTKIIITQNGISSSWLLSAVSKSTIAFQYKNEEVVKIPGNEALVHSFLPTEVSSGLGVLLNCDFSTDPSRRHLIYDDQTISSIKECAYHIMGIVNDCLNTPSQDSVQIINALIPYNDPRTLLLKARSFEKYLLEELQLCSLNTFDSIRLPPSWLNPKDYYSIVDNNFKTFEWAFLQLQGFKSYSLYLGSSESHLNDFKEYINNTEITTLGCVQISKYIFKILISGNLSNKEELSDIRVIYTSQGRLSLIELSSPLVLDERYLSLLLENGITQSDIKYTFSKFVADFNFINNKSGIANNTHTKVPNPDLLVDKSKPLNKIEANSQNLTYGGNQSRSEGLSNTYKSKPFTNAAKWRSAEELTLLVLNAYGYNLEDVSKQNIGYDISGTDPKGNPIQIEVKSINLPGQKFKLTNNEIAVAQEKQDSYNVAVVRQINHTLEICLIPNPINNLSFNRQCVQWIWECDHYDYNPVIFNIE
ncbi:DUF3883 domain-containing protein [Arundinibacter roseus]|uniref:DUF3883 domain-containing protein n=1 Tax=Arundinibacter roseus TaxID=2070510 RepID=A0A4R4KLC4_9BACT|nr:DUF3883 domain-containing protein [Arundinibacter roseus]TDB69150.1 DUF3883 domain-containing protein [Arundinibacter roseus]